MENEGITVSALAKMLNASPASISVSLKRMEKTGFIIKKPDKEDSRLIRLYPVQKAKDAPENVKKHMESLENTLSKGMSKEEALSFSDLFQKAIDNMKERE
ncbi:MAG: MarR family transcriptional regulator [Clostridiales bacterium]|nr:MarR family transcriptional regulator [Clostridiales bacterium]